MSHKRGRGIGPLRVIVRTYTKYSGQLTIEVLSCGHEQNQRHDHMGPTNVARRRCWQCEKTEKTEKTEAPGFNLKITRLYMKALGPRIIRHCRYVERLHFNEGLTARQAIQVAEDRYHKETRP